MYYAAALRMEAAVMQLGRKQVPRLTLLFVLFLDVQAVMKNAQISHHGVLARYLIRKGKLHGSDGLYED